MGQRSIILLICAVLVLLFIFFGGGEVYAMIKKRTAKYIGAETPYDDLIQKYARKYGVDPLLIRAVIQQESNWQESVMGEDGLSVGLMQITLPLAHDFFGRDSNFTELADPETSINIGAWYLGKLIPKYGTTGALASYNEGPGNWLKGKHDEVYTTSVLAFYQQYQEGAA